MSALSVPMRLFLALSCVALLCGVDALRRGPALSPAKVRLELPDASHPVAEMHSLQPVARGNFAMPPGSRAAHASSLVVMPTGSQAAMTVFWFSGERESGPQVQIAAAQLDASNLQWSLPRLVVNRHVLGRQIGHGVRRLGNPVGWVDPGGRMHLAVVATGGGGWAASRIMHLRQRSDSAQLEKLEMVPDRVLPLSWFWNTSFLVRNAPLPLQDGGVLLPVHFELGLKVPAVVRLDADGRFLGMRRISRHDYWLQPALLPLTDTHWLALMRDERPQGRIGLAQTRDGGQHWEDLPDLDQPNPDASVAALAGASGQWLLAHNPVQEGRGQLDLSGSTDGLHWKRLHTVEKGHANAEFSYPAMAWACGRLWVSYTVEREWLAWQAFAPASAQKTNAQPCNAAGPSRGVAP